MCNISLGQHDSVQSPGHIVTRSPQTTACEGKAMTLSAVPEALRVRRRFCACLPTCLALPLMGLG